MEPTDERMDEFLEGNGIYNAKHILLSTRDETRDDLTEEELAEVKKLIDYNLSKRK